MTMADTTQRLLKLNVSLNPRGYRVYDGPVLPSYDAAGDLGSDYVFIETIRRYHGEGGETFPYSIMVELKETETELAHELERVMRLADESRIKARNMVKGWPRGRSTSQPLAKNSVWPWTYGFSMTTGEYLGEYGGPELIGLKRKMLPGILTPIRLTTANQAEDQRKAAHDGCVVRAEAHGSQRRATAADDWRGSHVSHAGDHRVVKLYNRFAEPQVITEQEWLAVKDHTAGHIDVETAVRLLMTNDHVKFQCTEGLQHKKRESARQKAERRGMKVNTMWADGWLYLKRIGVTGEPESEPVG